MTLVAQRLRAVRSSETKAMTARAAELREQGADMIILSQGEPDFDTPVHVREAGKRDPRGQDALHRCRRASRELPKRSPQVQRDNGLDFKPAERSRRRAAPSKCSTTRCRPAWTRRRGDRPRARWVSYPGDGTARGRRAGVVASPPQSDGIQDHAGSARGRHHAAHQVADAQFAVQSQRRGIYRAELLALAECCCRHPQV